MIGRRAVGAGAVGAPAGAPPPVTPPAARPPLRLPRGGYVLIPDDGGRAAMLGLSSPARDIALGEFFAAQPAARYVGAMGRARYLGTRDDAALYLGAGFLFAA